MFLILYIDKHKIGKKDVHAFVSRMNAINSNIEPNDVVRILINEKQLTKNGKNFIAKEVKNQNIII